MKWQVVIFLNNSSNKVTWTFTDKEKALKLIKLIMESKINENHNPINLEENGQIEAFIDPLQVSFCGLQEK